jgi:hypothetical protein
MHYCIVLYCTDWSSRDTQLHMSIHDTIMKSSALLPSITVHKLTFTSREKREWQRGRYWIFYVRYSTLLHLPHLRFHCVGGCLHRNPGLLRPWHWKPDALTAWLDLISLAEITQVVTSAHDGWEWGWSSCVSRGFSIEDGRGLFKC